MAKTNNEKRDNKVVASSIENNEKVNATVAAVAIPEGAKEIENENLTISEPGVYVTKGCAKDAILTIESIAKDAHDKTIVTVRFNSLQQVRQSAKALFSIIGRRLLAQVSRLIQELAPGQFQEGRGSSMRNR